MNRIVSEELLQEVVNYITATPTGTIPFAQVYNLISRLQETEKDRESEGTEQEEHGEV